MTFIEVDIRHRTASLRMFYSRDLDLNFQGQTIETL